MFVGPDTVPHREIGWNMRRRDFLCVAGTAAVAALPLAAGAQQPERVRLIAMLNTLGSDDPEAQARIAVFEQALLPLGWVVGRNLKIEIRQIGSNADHGRTEAAELVALAPDVILTIGSLAVGPLQQATRTIPIVFVNAPDPVGAGFVKSMGHPGGNITGFSNFEYSMSGKWADLLKQIAPNVTRALVMRDPGSAAGIGQFAAVRSVAQSLGVELTPVNVRDTDEIEQNVASFARSGNGGMIVTSGGTGSRRKLIIALASRYQLPTVYPYRYYAVDGGLMAYGSNTLDPVRRAAGYVDRILKGEKPDDMPVQAPTKYELVINLKTAKTLGLTVPQSLLTMADEVVE
jgi:putative ABC transport system substrate-binding protein